MSMVDDTLVLHGVRCAACVLKIERHLEQLPGVEIARGNATQKRMRLVWEDGSQSIASLIQDIRDLGYDATQIQVDQSAQKEPSLLPRLGVAAFGTMNIMAFSLSSWFGQATDMGPGSMQFMHWLSAGLAVPVMLYSGAVFHGPALRAMRHGRMTMDTPITLAIWITFAGSLYETIRGSEDVYFDAVVSLIFFLLIGRVLEQAMRRRTENAADNLRKLLDLTAHRIAPNGEVVPIPASDLVVGDRILVQSGARVPADGVLLSARGEFDESALTGETLPRPALRESPVAAGAIVTVGPVELKVSHVGAASQLGQLADLADQAASHKGRLQLLSDRFAQGYIPLVLIGGAFGFLLWYFVLGAPLSEALKIAIAVLIVTCPCAAGLATPAVTARAVNLALKAGIVVKSGRALEQLSEVDQIFLDKTGTASLPVLVPDAMIDPQVLSAAQSLAASSRHPLAMALAAVDQTSPMSGAKEHPGQGISAPNGARLGNAEFVGLKGRAHTQTMLFYRDPNGQITQIAFDEAARPDLEPFLTRTVEMGLDVSLHSGDVPEAVARFAERNGVTHWCARQNPAQKLDQVAAMQAKGQHVLMIGDGINDSAALSGAHVSVSFAGATDIAQAAADVVLTRPQLSLIPKAIDLSRAARRLIAQNLAFSTAYNVLSVPLALAGFLTPALAALLMSSSSLVVLANGLRLRQIE
ncbi:cation-translocating P-type ATPase [uncultured Roseobacter sp.]|uniref:heavy metal translocating P-type ATPase n=1 Tax=uncultured Roseobacter sp. TaxID=114847 RepID=UPI0026338D91|nr:cation-translocating P-type ATPase [uncultured Roseobacter sp.]